MCDECICRAHTAYITYYRKCELRDHDKKRYGGKGVLKAIENANSVIAKKIERKCFGSHRNGETADSLISDLTVAVNAGRLKTGSGCRNERIEEFNQLMRIEKKPGPAAKFAGIKAFKNQ